MVKFMGGESIHCPLSSSSYLLQRRWNENMGVGSIERPVFHSSMSKNNPNHEDFRRSSSRETTAGHTLVGQLQTSHCEPLFRATIRGRGQKEALVQAA